VYSCTADLGFHALPKRVGSPVHRNKEYTGLCSRSTKLRDLFRYFNLSYIYYFITKINKGTSNNVVLNIQNIKAIYEVQVN
jgi:hypothetical protein